MNKGLEASEGCPEGTEKTGTNFIQIVSQLSNPLETMSSKKASAPYHQVPKKNPVSNRLRRRLEKPFGATGKGSVPRPDPERQSAARLMRN